MRTVSSLALWVSVSLALAASAAGCDNGGGGGSLTIEEYGDGFVQTTCDLLLDCYGADIREAFVGADCEGSFGRSWDQATQPRLEEAIENMTLAYDGSRARACLDAIRAAGCGVIDRPSFPECDLVLVGDVGPGGACNLNEECPDDSYCRIESACPGACQVRSGAGTACTSDDACAFGLRCFGGTCQTAAGEGAPCQDDSEVGCRGGLICATPLPSAADPSPAGTCRSIEALQTAAMGDACHPTEGPLCTAGLSCVVTGIAGAPPAPAFECVAASAAGGACNLGFPDPCPSDQFCSDVNPMLLDFEGTCAPLPGNAEPCASDRCAEGNRCVSGQCRTVSSVGGACTTAADCYSGHCDGGTCADGVLCPG